ncbi:MAG: hypothetical protein ACREGA_03100 [Candidatus Saccharimonadales bacterium]
MEGLPNFETQEIAPPPDLLEAYADQEVTLFGQTGTFKDLADLCPVDLSTSSITQAAKNDFVVKAANQAGLAIKPEHESVFNETIERHGLERKFKVIATDKDRAIQDNPSQIKPIERKPAVVHDPAIMARQSKPVKPESAVQTNQSDKRPGQEAFAASLAISNAPPQPARLIQPAAAEQPSVAIAKEIDEQIRLSQQALMERETEADIAAKQSAETARSAAAAELDTAPPKQPASINHKIYQALHATEIQPAAPKVDIDEVLQPIDADTEAVAADFADVQTLPEATSLPNFDIGTSDLGSAEAFNLLADDKDYEISLELAELALPPMPYLADATEPLPAADQATAEIVELDWGSQLDKQSLELLEAFSEVLLNCADLPPAVLLAGETDQILATPSEPAGDPEKPEAEAPLITLVAEQLVELEDDEKQSAAVIIKAIVGAAHGLQRLEASQSEPATIAGAQTQLEALCLTLFQTIGLGDSDQDAEKFSQIILQPDFQPPPRVETTELDLAHLGTREVKRNFIRRADDLSAMAGQIRQTLGILVLFYANLAEPAYALAA